MRNACDGQVRGWRASTCMSRRPPPTRPPLIARVPSLLVFWRVIVNRLSARFVALLCVLSCASVAAVEVWPAGRDVRTADQNGDGHPDVWRRYDDRGQLTEVDVDSNFDGSPDIEEYYERGALVRRESDRNFNGQADLVEEFDAETHGRTRSVIDIDFDGTADLLVVFRDGRPVYSERTSVPGSSGGPKSDLPTVHQERGRHLAPLKDPFESDSAFRTDHTPWTGGGSVGLSGSSGLPCPLVRTLSQPSPSTGLVARSGQPHVSVLRLPHSPRAPPPSEL